MPKTTMSNPIEGCECTADILHDEHEELKVSGAVPDTGSDCWVGVGVHRGS